MIDFTDKEYEKIASKSDFLDKDAKKRIADRFNEKADFKVRQPVFRFRRTLAMAVTAVVLITALTVTAFATGAVQHFIKVTINGKNTEISMDDATIIKTKNNEYVIKFGRNEKIEKDGEKAQVIDTENTAELTVDNKAILHAFSKDYDITDQFAPNKFGQDECIVKVLNDGKNYLVRVIKEEDGMLSVKTGIIE